MTLTYILRMCVMQLLLYQVNGERRPVPFDIFSEQQQHTTIRCSIPTLVVEESPFYFKPALLESGCFNLFLGSKRESCNVAILCEQPIETMPTSGFAFVSDGTIGMNAMSQFAGNEFVLRPRFARNGGADLFVQNHRLSSAVVCAAFCLQDLTELHYDMGYVARPMPLDLISYTPSLNTDNSCSCGLKPALRGRIMSGREATPFEFPWLAAFPPETGKRLSHCGGALISDRHVVTAAHCHIHVGDDVLLHGHALNADWDRINEQRNFTDLLASMGIYQDPLHTVPGYEKDNIPEITDETEHSVRVQVEKVTNHPLYFKHADDKTEGNLSSWDISILTLTQRVNIHSPGTRPICLPPIDEYLLFPPNLRSEFAGWGMASPGGIAPPRLLQKIELDVYDCEKVFARLQRSICTVSTGAKGPFYGDSGGPLATKLNGNQYVLSGIISAGLFPGAGVSSYDEFGILRYMQQEKVLGMVHTFADVQEHAQWIHHIINEDLEETTTCRLVSAF